MPVTIYDVAKQANVGVGTVSRVLNDSPRVSPDTRQRVLEVIDRLNYRPSPTAQRLSRRKTLSIGVIAVFFTRPSVVERLRGIEAIAATSGYDLIVFNVETPAKRDAIFHATADSRRVDGLLVISLTPADADVTRWQSAGVPVVLVDTHHPALPRIVVDDVQGGYRAAQHLLELGHRRIAFVGDPIHSAFNFSSSRDRLAGLQRALAEKDIALPSGYHRMDEHSQESARVLTHRLLALDDPPTAIFAASDTQALGVMQAARELSLDHPPGPVGGWLRRHRDCRVSQPDHRAPAVVRIRAIAAASCCCNPSTPMATWRCVRSSPSSWWPVAPPRRRRLQASDTMGVFKEVIVQVKKI
ncbi:MAG: LacI family DNA-binding transcriptional regulator [Anaerolineae bacterium]